MRQTHQRGIAIGPILFVVAILAVLASAIAAGSGSFNGDTSAVKAKAQATAILGYANEVKLGVDRVLGKGCTDTQISFENPVVSGYENPNAPSDKSCHVFDVNGGGIVWKNPPKEIFYNSEYGQWYFVTGSGGGYSLSGLGTKEHDLFIWLPGTVNHVVPGVVSKGKALLAACEEINKMLGLGDFSRYANMSPFTVKFQGVFPASIGTVSSVPEILNKTIHCAKQTNIDYVDFTKVLIVH